MKLPGTRLSPMDQEYAKERFPDRYTGDHSPAWLTESLPSHFRQAWPLQFASDMDWLANSLFLTNHRAVFDRRQARYIGTPTWPNDPMLRFCPRCVWAAVAPNFRYKGWQRELRYYGQQNKDAPYISQAQFELAVRNWLLNRGELIENGVAWARAEGLLAYALKHGEAQVDAEGCYVSRPLGLLPASSSRRRDEGAAIIEPMVPPEEPLVRRRRFPWSRG